MPIPQEIWDAAITLACWRGWVDYSPMVVKLRSTLPNIHVATGGSKYVFIDDEWVIKFHRNPEDANREEWALQDLARRGLPVPETYRVSEQVFIQETCPIDSNRYSREHQNLFVQAQITDEYWRNLGFRRDGTPVFIDAGFYNPKEREYDREIGGPIDISTLPVIYFKTFGKQ